jgi:hypothetical protein
LLAFIDDNAKFDQAEAAPMLLLDGHCAVLNPSSSNTSMIAALNGPSALVHPMRLGENNGQNGSFKVAGNKRKEMVLQERQGFAWNILLKSMT